MRSKSKGTTTQKESSSKTARGKEKVKFLGYVNWTLSEQHKAAFDTWLLSGPDVEDLVNKIAEEGYDLKVRYDSYNQCMSAGFYCTDPNSGNAGWNLSMRAVTWVKALERLLFVHLIAFDTIWVTEKEQGWTDDAW